MRDPHATSVLEAGTHPAVSESPVKVRLAILRPTLGQGGADRVTLSLLRMLDRERFDVTLILCRLEGEFADEIPADVSVHSLEAKNLFRALGPLVRCLRDLHPDVLFSTSSGTNILAILARSFARREFRVILSERNVLYHGGRTLKRRILVQLKRRLYPRADCITAVSQGVKQDLVDLAGVSPPTVSVVYNPVVTDDLRSGSEQAVEHEWFGEEIPIVLGAGRLVAEKDFVTLIEAFAIVRRSSPARLVILGDGPLRPDLERLVRDRGLEDEVWFAGFEKNPFRYMAGCTVFVLSSRDEGLPGVLIQAMACGAPVVATNCHAGPSEIITSGIDGWLVPVGDPGLLAEKIGFYLRHPVERRLMAEKGQLSAQRFSAEAVLPAYLKAVSEPIVG